jgi:erythromycin esterase-like protein
MKTGFEARDAGMARALLAIRELRSPGQRVAVIAHNTHLAHAQSKVDGAYAGVRLMGQMLKEDHHAPYEAIGLLARTVHIDWGTFEDPPVASAEGDLEQHLHAVAHGVGEVRRAGCYVRR